MDSNATISDDQGSELDLEGYPAEHRPSLLEIAASSTAERLSRLGAAPSAGVVDSSLLGLIAIGLAIGIGLGILMLS
jgi:hypothetical protein